MVLAVIMYFPERADHVVVNRYEVIDSGVDNLTGKDITDGSESLVNNFVAGYVVTVVDGIIHGCRYDSCERFLVLFGLWAGEN